MAKIVSRKMPNYSSDTIGLKTVRKTPVSDAAARLKNGACETMPLPGEAARCRAIGWPMLEPVRKVLVSAFANFSRPAIF
jgi:hypothetical protein